MLLSASVPEFQNQRLYYPAKARRPEHSHGGWAKVITRELVASAIEAENDLKICYGAISLKISTVLTFFLGGGTAVL